MVMEPMQGKSASSPYNLGHTDLFCIPEVTSLFFSSCDSVVGDSLEFSQANRGSLRVWENAIALDTVQGNRASSHGAGIVHGFSRVAAGTWGIFSSYSGDVHSKL